MMAMILCPFGQRNIEPFEKIEREIVRAGRGPERPQQPECRNDTAQMQFQGEVVQLVQFIETIDGRQNLKSPYNARGRENRLVMETICDCLEKMSVQRLLYQTR